MASFFVKQVILTIIVREHIGAIAYRFPSHRSGWLPQTLHVPSNDRTVVNFIRGGSHSDEENNAADDENDEAKEEANEVSFQDQEPDEHIYREYHDLEDVEIIPFDSEDEECQNIDYVLVGGDNDETTLDNVQIIPFDSDYDDYHESVPFDDDAVEEVDPISDNKKSSACFDGVVHDQDEIRTKTEFETENRDTVSGLDGKEDDSKTTSISSDGTNESFRRFSSLRDRILSLLSLWRDMDNDTMEDGEHKSRSIRKLLHSRAIEYVDELTAFQTECKFCIAQNRSIPTIEKMAPHPKTFLHYVTPKIQAVKLTPEITLRIRNARPSDVGDAIRAIGILGCLVDLYIIALEELIPLVEDRIYDESESVKKEIRNDRRFGQLLECASCGIDIRRRLEDFTNYQRDGAFLLESKRDDDSDRDLEEKESSDLEDDEEQRPECIEVSECSRWIMGLLSLRVDGGMAIRSQNTTGVVLSLAMRSMDLLQVNFRHRGFDKKGKNSLLRDIVDMIRVLAYARDDLNIEVDFIVEACVGFLWKDLTSLEVKDEDVCSEYEMDELVNKLTLSETHDTNEKSRNATSPQKNSTATENPNDDFLSDNTTRAPECLIDYLSPQQRIVVLKSCTRLIGKSQLITNTINSLVDHAIHDLDSDMRKLEIAEGKDNTHEIESVDAAILLASIADTHDDTHLLDTVGSKVAGSQIISTPSMDFLDGVQVEESSIDDTLYDYHLRTCGDMNLITIPQVFFFENIAIAAKMHYRCVIWDDIDSRSPINLISQDMKLMMYLDDVRTALSKGSKAGAMRKITPEAHPGGTYISAMQIAKNRLKTSLCDCSVIIQAAVAINHKSTTLVMESCLRIAEASTSETMRKMETGDVINLISAIASIGSNTPMTMQSANTLTVLIRMALCREYRTFTVIQLSRLLEAIATTISTQRFPIIYDLVNDESILALIEHGMERMKCSEIATIQDLANLAWAYAECNKLCSRSSWEHFENLGRCVAAVSSGFTNEGTRTDAAYNESIAPAIDHNILCKIAFAVSLMDLDAHDLNQAILEYSRIDKSLFGPTNLLNQIRLLYSIAKSKQNMEHAIPPKYNRDVKRCITAVMKAKMDNLSPYNFALVVWSIGRLCGGEEISSLMTNLPSYTREELGVLSPTMVLRLMNGIVMVFDAEDIQTNTRVQMMLKNLLLHLDNQIDAMTPKELCGAGRILVNLRSSCLPDGDENIVKVPELKGVILEDDDHDIENEAEELVISSLFPSSYRRDVMQICDVIVTHILNRARTSIAHFTPAEMTILLDTFDAKHRKPIFDTIKVEIDRRLGLVRNELSKTDNADIEEGAKVEDKIHSKSYRSKLRNLFHVGGRSGDETTYDGNESEEVSQVINLLRDTLNEDALNMVLLRTAFDSAYDLGRCRWQTTRGLQNRKCAPDCSLSDLYP